MSRRKVQKRWSAKEVAILEETYPASGTAGCAPLLPGRSRSLIRQKAHYMGLKLDDELATAWTSDEIHLLQEVFPEEGVSCAARFPRRSRGAVLRKAERMGLTSQCGSLGEAADPADRGCGQSPDAESQGIQPRKWTAAEERTLRRYYPAEGVACAARLPGRTKAMVSQHAFFLGIKSKKIWSPEEDEILCRYYPAEKAGCAARLPGRSPKQIVSRAWYLGLSDARRPRRQADQPSSEERSL